jgi:hypothetical protein
MKWLKNEYPDMNLVREINHSPEVLEAAATQELVAAEQAVSQPQELGRTDDGVTLPKESEDQPRILIGVAANTVTPDDWPDGRLAGSWKVMTERLVLAGLMHPKVQERILSNIGTQVDGTPRQPVLRTDVVR